MRRMIKPNTVTIVLRDDSPCASYGGPPSFRSVHIRLSDEQLQRLDQRDNEDVNNCFMEHENE